MTVMAVVPVRFDLVVPLAHKATARRIRETGDRVIARSRAVSPLSIRRGDVDSTTYAVRL